MGKFVEFAEILEGKIRKSLVQEAAAPTKVSTAWRDTSPSCLTQLLGVQKVFTQPSPLGKNIYLKQMPPRPPHALSVAQQKARDFFGSWGFHLSPHFSRLELKKAYRRLALKVHPDQQGESSEGFLRLRQSYECLQGVFKK